VSECHQHATEEIATVFVPAKLLVEVFPTEFVDALRQVAILVEQPFALLDTTISLCIASVNPRTFQSIQNA
jgi:hypothetical protein